MTRINKLEQKTPLTSKEIEALIDQEHKAGYIENRAVSEWNETANKRRAELQQELAELDAEQNRRTQEYYQNETARRTRLDAWNEALNALPAPKA